MSLMIDLQQATEDEIVAVPDKAQFQLWADSAAAACHGGEQELVIRVTGNRESAELNDQYRHKTGPTNVLSFPFEDPPGVTTGILGDLVICAPVVNSEAAEQHKPVEAHWAHMVVHGVLHLYGYDHLHQKQADEMEALETTILATLGYPPPYRETEQKRIPD